MKTLLMSFALCCLFFAFAFNAFSQIPIFGKIEEYDKSKTAKRANQKLESNDVAGALKILDQAIEKNVDLFEAYRTRSFIRRRYNDDIDGAITDLTKALEIKPDDVDLYISRAYLKKTYKKDFNGALEDYQTAQKYQPDSALLSKLKASVKADLKDFDGALDEIRAALKIAPADIDLNVKLVDLLELKKDTDKAIIYLQSFLDDYVKKTNGNLPKIKGEKIKKNKIASDFKDFPNAKNTIPVKRYSQMEFSSPNDYETRMKVIEEARSLSQAFIRLSKMYIGRNEFDKAFTNLNTALEIDKNQEEAYGLRGILYLSKKDYKKAIAELSSAIDISDVPYFYLNRGIAYLSILNNKDAQSDFDYFLKIYPDGKAILDKRIAETKEKILQNSVQPK